MKSKITTKSRKVFTAITFILLSIAAFSQPHVSMSLKNIKATSNTIEYDLYIINDGSASLKLSACSFGVNFDGSILNQGRVTYSLIEKSEDQALNGLTNFSLAITKTDEINQARMTSTPVNADNAPELIRNVSYKVGRFKIKNSNPWTQNSNPLFSLLGVCKSGFTSTQLVAYIGTGRILTAMTTTLRTVATVVDDSPLLNPLQNANEITTHDNNLLARVEKINVYPNPVADILKIDMDATPGINIDIRISDLHGNMVKDLHTISQEGNNRLSINLSGINEGIFMIGIFKNNKQLFSQAIKKNN